WKAFFQTPMIAPVRNLWFRLTHEKLSNRQSLFRIMPNAIADDNCNCSYEDFDQFIICCPIKLQVYQLIWSQLFQGSVDL
ncbi:hypothetical protein BD560DRAFT_299557, partial [Blakeslea trispora]